MNRTKRWLSNDVINLATKQTNSVMPDLIRHPVHTWIPAFAGMTILRYLIAGVIISIPMGNDYIGKRLKVTGIVQGVGFRPFVYQLANQSGLKGKVANTPTGFNGAIIECLH